MKAGIPDEATRTLELKKVNKLAKEMTVARLTSSGEEKKLANEDSEAKEEANVEDIIAGVITCRLSREVKTTRA